MKIFEIYKNVLRENEANTTAEFCFNKFGNQLFADQLGGNEPNNETEKKYVILLRRFTNNEYGSDINSETIKALNDLRDCMYKFPEILVTEGIVYRGTRVPFKVIFDNINNFRENQIPYTYKAKSILQSWSEDFGIGEEYAYGKRSDNLPTAFKDFQKVKYNYVNMNEKEQIRFLSHLIDKYGFTAKNVPIVLAVDASEKEFLFKGRYFRYLSNYEHEEEVLRFGNSPLDCTLISSPIVLSLALEIKKYFKQLGLDADDFVMGSDDEDEF